MESVFTNEYYDLELYILGDHEYFLKPESNSVVPEPESISIANADSYLRWHKQIISIGDAIISRR